MGFLNGLGRMLQGKPVFENPGAPVSVPTPKTQPASNKTAVDARGYKIIPEIELDHCESHINGETMEVSAWITNTSDLAIELDKIIMLGQKMELDHYLKPKQGRELRLYRGSIPKNNNYHQANVRYKLISSGDYFQADFTIEYNLERDGKYTIEEFHPIRPIRDI